MSMWWIVAGLFVLLTVVFNWPVRARYAKIPVALTYPIWAAIVYCFYRIVTR